MREKADTRIKNSRVAFQTRARLTSINKYIVHKEPAKKDKTEANKKVNEQKDSTVSLDVRCIARKHQQMSAYLLICTLNICEKTNNKK